LPSDRECTDREVDGDLPLGLARTTYTEETEEFCYCKVQDEDDLEDDDDLNDFCGDYLDQALFATRMKYAVSVAVIVINYLLKVALRILTKIEKAPN